MDYDESSEFLSLDSPGQWESEADRLCEVLGIGAPEYLLGSDKRGEYPPMSSKRHEFEAEVTDHVASKGLHTAWGYAVRLEAIYITPRYWYSWESKHNAKEATAEELVRKIYKEYYNSEPEPLRNTTRKKCSRK